ncbi:hypothetical protein M0R45_007533 [Rubus argutus]|uniref:Uncharacterized protein n=1 Tax=Rubus argutus TaxID=59490 RepID=A0AAW1XYI9_RUBAR
MAQKWQHLLLLLLLISGAALSQNFTNTLPGYPGELPFSLETGYVGVGDMEEALVACSAFSGLVYEIGPSTFDYAAFNGSVPTFLDNPYSWTQIDNVIFVDAHVGTGFTYSTTQEDFYTDDYKYAEIAYHFLRKQQNPHAPKLAEPVSALFGKRLTFHNRILTLIRQNDLDEAALFTHHSIYSNCRPTIYTVNSASPLSSASPNTPTCYPSTSS